MAKKPRFSFLSKSSETTSSWPWPTCVNNPKTLSFRSHNGNIFKTTNYRDNDCSESTQDSFLEYDEGLLNASQVFANNCHESSIETMIRGLTTADRLFFDPGQETSSILEEAKTPFKGSVEVMTMESKDPIVDFRVSMEEMVEAHGLKNWDCLEELLACYLQVNCKSNHGYIVGAFVDLLINLAFSSRSGCSGSTCDTGIFAIDEPCCCLSTSSATHSFTSPLSYFSSTSFTSPCLSLVKMEGESMETIVDNASSSSDVCL